MGGEWIETTVGEAFEVNPPRPLKRGLVAPFIPMDALPIHARTAERMESREFTGSGSRFKNGDTLIARITPCLENGKTVYVAGLPDGSVGYGSTEYIVLAARESLSDSLYGYYLSRSPDFRRYAISHMEGTSGRQRVPSTAVENYVVKLPPLPEQRAIAHILGTLDDKIELNRRRNQTLEAMARALFKDWFVDFGPVRAKMEGREPYLPADLWQPFPDRLDDEDKPEGWRCATLASFASLNPESWTRKNAPHEIRYVDLSNAKQGTIEGAALIHWSEAPSRAQRVLRPGDTIVGTVRPGNKSFALIADQGMTGSTGLAVLRPQEKYFRDFVFLAATSPENIERLSHLADGAAYPAVRPDVVLASPVTVPPGGVVNDVLRGFSNAVSGWVDAVEQNKQESQTLAQLRDTLLPKLISGELRIADAEKFMERAA